MRVVRTCYITSYLCLGMILLALPGGILRVHQKQHISQRIAILHTHTQHFCTRVHINNNNMCLPLLLRAEHIHYILPSCIAYIFRASFRCAASCSRGMEVLQRAQRNNLLAHMAWRNTGGYACCLLHAFYLFLIIASSFFLFSFFARLMTPSYPPHFRLLITCCLHVFSCHLCSASA